MSQQERAVADPYSPHTGNPALHVEHYTLALTVKLAGNRLDGTATLRIECLEDLERVELDLVGLGVSRVSVNGRKVAFRHRDGRLSFPVKDAGRAGSRLEAEIRYSGVPGPRMGPWGDVGWEELEDGVLVAGQPDGASTWFPCNDTPGDKAAYDIEISTDAGYRALANGRLVGHRRTASRETWSYTQEAPMAPYLATVQIGRYEAVSAGAASAPVPDGEASVTAFTVPAARARAAKALADQPRMMATFEAEFGPYPFAAYSAVVTEDTLEIPLEAQGLSIFGDNHLSTAWEAQRLIAHELSHQWFGNSLTVATWRDLWLHEGFACFSEWIWSEASGGPSVEERARSAWRGLRRSAQDLAIGDPGPADMFDDRLYKRGAMAVYALRVAAGPLAFRELLHAWTARHRHGTVSRAGFEAHLREFSPGGLDLVAVLRPWLDETAVPEFPA